MEKRTHWSSTERDTFLEQANMQGLRQSIAFMPDGSYKQFNHWLLSQSALAPRWAQVLGLRHIAGMTDRVLDVVLTPQQARQMVQLAVPMNILLTYEVASDNIAFGLAHPAHVDATQQQRTHLLTHFGEAMIAKLQGDPTPTPVLASGIRDLARGVSSFEQSLAREAFEKLVGRYAQLHAGVDVEAIEFALHDILIANIESGKWVVDSLEGYAMQACVRQWLTQRYAGQNVIINSAYLHEDDLLQYSTDAIMVVAVLGYYIAHLVERVAPMPYESLLNDGTLLTALENTALLVRILNDMGTELAERTPQEHVMWVDYLRRMQARKGYESFYSLMSAYLHTADDVYTRLKKDILFGEYNLPLYYPRLQDDDVNAALDALQERLIWVSQVYQHQMHSLQKRSKMIALHTRQDTISNMLLAFVDYHRRIYQHAFDSPEGEYAVAG